MSASTSTAVTVLVVVVAIAIAVVASASAMVLLYVVDESLYLCVRSLASLQHFSSECQVLTC